MRTLTLLILSAATALAADVSGVIKLNGPQPKRPPLQLTPESRKLYEGRPYPRDEVELVSAKGEIKNVFVYIRKGLPAGKTYAAPKKAALLDQQRSMFRPRIQGLFVGQDFAMRNSDPIIHNVRSLTGKPPVQHRPARRHAGSFEAVQRQGRSNRVAMRLSPLDARIYFRDGSSLLCRHRRAWAFHHQEPSARRVRAGHLARVVR